MKIGILTFHSAYNYGAVLQCYALQTALKDLGHDVDVIDYRPDYITRPYKVFRLGRFQNKSPRDFLRLCAKEPFMIPRRQMRKKVFERFISERLHLSLPVNNAHIPSGYDAYVMGSDQIWNPHLTEGYDPVYFGSFPFPKENRKYISYAASMGNVESEDEIKCSFDNFDALSVREHQLADLLHAVTKQKIDTVLDPTLLLDERRWSALAKKPAINEKYVLAYLDSDVVFLDIARRAAKQLGAIVVQIPLSTCVSFGKNVVQDASPEEFLGWVKYASCVVTPSFHGSAFSLIFKKTFYSLEMGGGRNMRTWNLLSSLGLEDRFWTEGMDVAVSQVDYSKALLKMSILKSKSMGYLSDAIVWPS